MIIKFQEFILEYLTPFDPESKTHKRNLEWFARNQNLETIPVKWEDLPKYNLPPGIIEKMKVWDEILKSPYSNSFYSTSQTSWNHKPEGSFRVSNHWNFYSRRDSKIHCKTVEPIENDWQWCLGQFEGGKYRILYCEEDPIWKDTQSKKKRKMMYLKDPDVIWKKKQFAQLYKNWNILVDLRYEGQEVSGILNYYSGDKIEIVKSDFDFNQDVSSQIIYSNKNFNPKKADKLVFRDLDGKVLEDPFILPDF